MYNVKNNPIFVIAPVLAIFLGAIPTALADQNAYNFTVHVPSHGFGVDAVTIFVQTSNGYTTFLGHLAFLKIKAIQ